MLRAAFALVEPHGSAVDDVVPADELETDEGDQQSCCVVLVPSLHGGSDLDVETSTLLALGIVWVDEVRIGSVQFTMEREVILEWIDVIEVTSTFVLVGQDGDEVESSVVDDDEHHDTRESEE